jgi:hypothetical protein
VRSRRNSLERRAWYRVQAPDPGAAGRGIAGGPSPCYAESGACPGFRGRNLHHARIGELGATVIPSSPGEFGTFVSDEIEKWGKVVNFAGIRPD